MKLSKGTTRLVAQGTGTCIFGEDTNRVSTGLLPGCVAARHLVALLQDLCLR